MRKIRNFLLTSLLLIGMTVMPVYGQTEETAEPISSTQAIEEVVEKADEEQPELEVNLDSVTDGFHVYIIFPLGIDKDLVESGLITYTLGLEDAEGNEISTAVANAENFDGNGFAVRFNIPSFRVGELYHIRAKGYGELSMPLVVEQHTLLQPSECVRIHIELQHFVLDEENTKEERFIKGSNDNPVMMVAGVTADKAVLRTVDEENNPLSSVNVLVKDMVNNSSITVSTNSQGFALVPFNEKSSGIELSLASDYNGLTLRNSEDGVVTQYVIPDGTPQSLRLVLSGVNNNDGISPLTVVTTSKYNSDLNKSWSKFNIALESDGQIQKITNFQYGEVTTNVPAGEYEVSVVGNLYADIKLNSTTLNARKSVKLEAEATPKYILEVLKKEKSKNIPYSFKVINVPEIRDNVYSGNKPSVFAVSPGNTYMIQDTETGEVTTVTISPEEGITQVELGVGVVNQLVATVPYTGDNVLYAIIGLVVSVCLLVIGLILIHKCKINTKSILSVLISVTMVATSLITPQQVHAAINGDVTGNWGGYKAASGQLQFFNLTSPAIVRVTAVINSTQSGLNLKYDALEEDLANRNKFNFKHFSLYIATDKLGDDRWRSAILTQMQPQSQNPDEATSLISGIGWGNAFDGKAGREPEGMRLVRTLPYAGSKPSNLQDNLFYTRLSNALQEYNIVTGVKPGETLDFGSSLSDAFDRASPEDKGQILTDFIAYLEANVLGKPGSNLTPEALQALKNAVSKQDGSVSLLFETLAGAYYIGQGYDTVENRKAAIYISAHDYIYLNAAYGIANPGIFNVLNYERKAIPSMIYSCYPAGDPRNASGHAKTDYIAFSGKQAMTRYVSTLYPVTATVGRDLYAPYGGWAFSDFKDGVSEASPGLWVELNVVEVDGSGNPTGNEFKYQLPGWSKADVNSHQLSQMGVLSNRVVKGEGVFLHNGVKYYIMPEDNVPVTIVDDQDSEELDSGTVNVSKDGFKITLGLDTEVVPEDIGEYLGIKPMSKSNALVNIMGSTDSKYKDAGKDANGKDIYGNAKLSLTVKVINSTNIPDAEDIVPQWRLAKYNSEIIDSKKKEYWQYAISKLIFSPDTTTHRMSTISPSGNVNFNLIDPDLSTQPWFRSVAKTIILNDTIRSITHDNPTASIAVFGDLLSIKENTEIDNIKTAQWVANNPILTSLGIGSTIKGDVSNRAPVLSKEYVFKYGIKNPFSYSHNKAVYSHYTCVHEFYSHDVCACYTELEEVTESTSTADYKLKMHFKRYHPEDTTAPQFEDVEVVENGFASIAAQSPVSLNVNPEVAMLVADETGRDSVVFVAGDKMREIKPVSYHTMTYEAEVKPTVVGTSVATDMKAQALAGNLGAPNKPVINKGSGVNISFDIDGKLTTKSFILDIGGSMKQVWNPGTPYDPKKINDEFLSKFGTYDSENGKWNFTAKATQKLKIKDNLYGQNVQDVKFENTAADNTVKTHRLTVRGNTLVAVNDDYNFRNTLKGTELLRALENMKLTDPTDSVLAVFETNKGDIVTEQAFVDLTNLARKTNQNQLNKGWYSEDTTVLVVYEYTSVFKLPISMFSDKLPMEIPGLNAPVDKNQFYTQGATGHTIIRYGLWGNEKTLNPYDDTAGAKDKDVFMEHDSSTGSDFGKKETQFIAPNVSIMDTTY